MLKTMKNVYKQKREQGFTIIEVLIVLAIAALIFLIVFLAVPALNRNSRNNAIKHDAADILSAVQTFESNNNGQLPATSGGCGVANGSATISNTAANAQANSVSVQPSTTCSSVSAATPATPGLNAIAVDVGFDCNGANVPPFTANTRSVAVYFVVESGGANVKQCLSS